MLSASTLAPLLQRIFADANLRTQLQRYFLEDWALYATPDERWLVLGSPRGWLCRVFDVRTCAFVDTDGDDCDFPRFTIDPESGCLHDIEADRFILVTSLDRDLAEVA